MANDWMRIPAYRCFGPGRLGRAHAGARDQARSDHRNGAAQMPVCAGYSILARHIEPGMFGSAWARPAGLGPTTNSMIAGCPEMSSAAIVRRTFPL